MELALEGGLGAERVKMGAGEKQEGLAFRSSTVKRIVLAVLGIGLVLAAGLSITYRDAIQHRYNLFTERESHAKKQLQGEASSIAQNLQLEAALAVQMEAKEDVIRVLKRIRGFTGNKVAEALAAISDPSEREKVKSILGNVERFMDEERADYEDEARKAEVKRRAQIDKIHKSQNAALHKLLTRVTDVRLEALEEMLEDIFERMEESIEVSLPPRKWQDLENLVDKLYQEEMTLEDGLTTYDRDFARFFDVPVPADMEKKLRNAKNAGDLADILDEVYEGVQVFRARDELASIKKTWMAMQDKADKVDPKDADAVDEAEEEYIKSTVEAVIEVQGLINKGLIPEDFLDFDAIDLEEDDEDEDELGDDDPDAAKRKRGGIFAARRQNNKD